MGYGVKLGLIIYLIKKKKITLIKEALGQQYGTKLLSAYAGKKKLKSQ